MKNEEHYEQSALFQWAALETRRIPELALLYAVPNGARTRISVAVKLKKEGLKSGVPDVVLPVARGPYHGLYIEMKKEKGGKTSAEQKWWIDRLTHQGYFADVCAGFDSAREKIEWYLVL